jgi:serine/threonine protein kinase
MIEVGAEVEVSKLTGERETPFVVQGRWGQGGQGFVYALASSDGRLAVLKVPGERAVVTTEIERRILAALPPHRNIVRLVGTTEVQGIKCPVLAWAHDNPFLRLNETPLAPSIESFRSAESSRIALPATTALEMVQEVLAALEHMHAHGFVHGDVKPQNILVEIGSPRTRLRYEDYFAAIQWRSYRTILIDFGTARSFKFLETRDAKADALVPKEFTPIYAPPEIIRGVGTSHGGPAVDVYQVGLLLYELLTGRYPYEHVDPDIGKLGLSESLIELKRAELTGARRPFHAPSIRDARQYDVVFAEAFAAERLKERFYEHFRDVVDAATAPDPEKRPTAAALRAEVIRLFGLEAPSHTAATPGARVSMWNPRWHLVRDNRLSLAARVPGPEEMPDPSDTRTKTAPELREQPAPRVEPKGLRVALVDDDKVTLTILSNTLRRRGYRVRAFQDPEQALDVLSRDHPDVAICDMQMPQMSGLELVRALEQRVKAQPFPIMILSSVGQEATLAEAFQHGVTDYLVKPVSEAELVVKLEKAFARRRERPPEQIPHEVSGYELLEEVRRGETAILFRAQKRWEPGIVRRAKVLRPDLAGEAEPLLRFRREVDVLAACDHPAVPRLLATGLVGRLLYYISDDETVLTLGERVRERGRLSQQETFALLREAGGALEHLHERDVFHGDITPESLCVKESGAVQVSELGCARSLRRLPREDEPCALASRYTARELVAAPWSADPRSDLYSLGVCALEAFTGRPATQDRSFAVDARLLASVPPPLHTVLVRLVAPLEDRFPTARELLEALDRLDPDHGSEKCPSRS